jgi:hypothetical protein
LKVTDRKRMQLNAGGTGVGQYGGDTIRKIQSLNASTLIEVPLPIVSSYNLALYPPEQLCCPIESYMG